jgi:hypothetical protein
VTARPSSSPRRPNTSKHFELTLDDLAYSGKDAINLVQCCIGSLGHPYQKVAHDLLGALASHPPPSCLVHQTILGYAVDALDRIDEHGKAIESINESRHQVIQRRQAERAGVLVEERQVLPMRVAVANHDVERHRPKEGLERIGIGYASKGVGYRSE